MPIAFPSTATCSPSLPTHTSSNADPQINSTTNPPTIQWEHPGVPPGQAHPEQLAAQKFVSENGGTQAVSRAIDDPGMSDPNAQPGERGLGTVIGGAAMGGIASKLFGKPGGMGVGQGMAAGAGMALAGSVIGKLIKVSRRAVHLRYNDGRPLQLESRS